MRVFDYECKDCEKVIEKYVRDAKEVVLCKSCGEPMKKLLCAPGFQLKGTGWYQTDFKHK